MNWFALYTKAKQEKVVTAKLEQLGIEVFCPMITEVKQWSDRKKKVEVPLISSYIFVRLEEKNRGIVFDVPGVVRYLFWLGKPAIVSEKDIVVLKESLNGAFTAIQLTTIGKGDTLILDSGPFQGKEGIVTEVHKNSVRLILKELGFIVTITK